MPKDTLNMPSLFDKSVPAAVQWVTEESAAGRLVYHHTLTVFIPHSMQCPIAKQIGRWLMAKRKAVQAYLDQAYAEKSMWIYSDGLQGSTSRVVDIDADKSGRARRLRPTQITRPAATKSERAPTSQPAPTAPVAPAKTEIDYTAIASKPKSTERLSPDSPEIAALAAMFGLSKTHRGTDAGDGAQ